MAPPSFSARGSMPGDVSGRVSGGDSLTYQRLERHDPNESRSALRDVARDAHACIEASRHMIRLVGDESMEAE